MRVRDGLITFAAALAAALLIRQFILGAVRVPSPSMEYTLHPGDYVLVNKLFASRFVPARRGDVALVRLPAVGGPPDGLLVLKRIIGLPGDSVSIRGGAILVNGIELRLPATAIGPAPSTVPDFGPVAVPARGHTFHFPRDARSHVFHCIEQDGHSVQGEPGGAILIDGIRADSYEVGHDCYFLLGDNTPGSLDSRDMGPVPEKALLGRAIMVFWSVDPSSWQADFTRRARAVRWDRIGRVIR